jgi:hypothetical protein
MRRLISAALVAALMAPAVAQAQQHQHGQPQTQGQKKEMGAHQMGGMQGGMHGGMQMGGGLPGPLRSLVPYAPDNVLKMKEMLELSADQEKQLTELAAWAKKAGDEAHAPAEASMKSLRAELEKPEPNKASLQALLVAHATAMGNMQWVRADAAMQAKALLTEAQRKHVEEMK